MKKQIRIPTMSDMSLSKMTIGKPRKFPSTVAKDSRVRYMDTYQTALTNPIGAQGVFSLKYHLHRNQLVGTPNTVENDRSTSAQNIFDLNPSKNTTGGGVFGVYNPNNATGYTNDLVYVGKHMQEITLTSFSPIPVHIELYWLLCNKDTDSEPTSVWSDLNFALNGGQGVAQQANNNAQVPVAGYLPFTFYGTDTTSNPEFKRHWKILQKKEFVLPPSSTTRMQVTRNINRLIKRTDISNTSMQRKLTMVPMIVMKPAPVLVTVNGDDSQNVNTGSATLGCMMTDSTNYYHLPDMPRPINRAFNANITVDRVNAVQRFFDEDDDIVKVIPNV